MDPAVAIEVAALSRQKTLEETIARGDSDVQMFYKDAVVFVTGGSGFLGKALIEKLLRSCQVAKIYMLLRPKKGKQIQERIDETFKDLAFDTLRQQQPHFVDKIHAIKGDVAELQLGINNEDWKTLTQEVDVIFNVAATTRFDETLKLATLINVRGTRETLLLGRACNKLKSFVHVSTAYTHASTDFIGTEVYEKFYEAPMLPETIISMAENMDPDTLTNITDDLIAGWPNTYTFTKLISEELIRTSSEGLPICIVRPGIVICSYREPAPGWLDHSCVFGATGMLTGAAIGVLHVVNSEFDGKLGLTPCDHVNNAIIVAAKHMATEQNRGGDDTKIYTVTSTHRNSTSWGMVTSTITEHGRKIPTPLSIYYSFVLSTPSNWLYSTLSFLLHLVPAYFADCVALLFGYKRQFVKIAEKANKMCNKLSYFLVNEWDFVDDNLVKLYDDMSATDKIIFDFDISNINWLEYCMIWCIGTRKYILKDGLKNTDYALKKQRYLKFVNYIVLVLYAYAVYKLFSLVFYLLSCFF